MKHVQSNLWKCLFKKSCFNTDIIDDQVMILKLAAHIKSQFAKYDFQTTQNHVSDEICCSKFQMI